MRFAARQAGFGELRLSGERRMTLRESDLPNFKPRHESAASYPLR
jgi:hypothetical protein